MVFIINDTTFAITKKNPEAGDARTCSLLCKGRTIFIDSAASFLPVNPSFGHYPDDIRVLCRAKNGRLFIAVIDSAGNVHTYSLPRLKHDFYSFTEYFENSELNGGIVCYTIMDYEKLSIKRTSLERLKDTYLGNGFFHITRSDKLKFSLGFIDMTRDFIISPSGKLMPVSVNTAISEPQYFYPPNNLFISPDTSMIVLGPSGITVRDENGFRTSGLVIVRKDGVDSVSIPDIDNLRISGWLRK
jgi:hypothetical protein